MWFFPPSQPHELGNHKRDEIVRVVVVVVAVVLLKRK